jgi:hypothetical protein
MKWLEEFILGIPTLLLKKIPYAWLGVVCFWSWPPVFSGILMAIVLLGLLMLVWQQWAWETRITRDFSGEKTQPYIDHPHAPRSLQVRNLVLVLAGSAALGWLLGERFILSGLQWALLFAGIMLLRDTVLFGAAVTYIITDQGIGIRFVGRFGEYRLFIKFSEIRQAVRTKPPEQIPQRWDILTPQRNTKKEGVLLTAVRPKGFTNQIQAEVFLAPTDIDRFLEALKGHVAVMEDAGAKPG